VTSQRLLPDGCCISKAPSARDTLGAGHYRGTGLRVLAVHYTSEPHCDGEHNSRFCESMYENAGPWGALPLRLLAAVSRIAAPGNQRAAVRHELLRLPGNGAVESA
jgi:hypothetical protein